ncbi:MAG TPA: restriction endonuclease subunit S [Candidatus Angelobacter sp.]|nr:restriction endonuclease subunit S [Candidatus Angelobacter sp.]
MSWQLRKIGDLCKVGRGSSPRPKNDQRFFEGGTIPWIKVADATSSGKYLWRTKEHVNAFGASFSRLLPVGSLIICTSGTLGLPVFLGVEGCIHDGWLYTYEYDGLVPQFFYYFLLTRRDYFASVAYGAAIQNINTDILRETPIRLPSLEEQIKIAAILKSYDDLIENNRRRMALLEDAAGLLYSEWFVRLRFPGYEHVENLNGVPNGWRRVPTPEAVDINPPTPLSEEGEHWHVEMAELPTNSMVIQHAIRRDGRSGSKFRNGDTLFARITPCLENGKTAFVDFMEDGEVARGSTEFIVLRSKLLTPEFVYCLSRTYDFRENAIKSMVGSSGRQRVQESCFEKFQVWIPPELLLTMFTDTVRPMFKQIRLLHGQNQKLQAARDLLLPRLMSGEMTVSQAIEGKAASA